MYAIRSYYDEVDKIETLYSRKCDTHFRNLAIIHCGLDAGLRSSDIIGLDLCDVDFQKNYIHIKGDNSKGYRERYIKLSQKLKGYLLQYKLVFRNPNQDPHAPRITSYNVCYTKLLREDLTEVNSYVYARYINFIIGC